MKSRHFQRAGMVVGAIFAALLFFMGGAALRLLIAPISLGPFAGAIEDSLNRSISGLVVRFDQAVLEWSRADGNINLIILGARVFDVNGRIVAQAPKADLDFDAGAMLAGNFSLKRFALLGVQLTAVRDQDGVLRLGFGPVQGDADLLQIIRDTLRRSHNEGGSLESFSIREARLAFRDEASGLFIIAPNISFGLQNADDRFTAALDAAVEISGAPAQVSARADLRENGTPERGTLTLKGLDLAALAANSPKFAALKRYALKSDLTARYELAENGEVMVADFQLSGAGTIAAPELQTEVQIDELTVAGRYDGTENHLLLENAVAKGPELDVTAKGEFRFAWADGVLNTIAMGVSATAAKLSMPSQLAAPVRLDSIVVQASYERAARKVNFQRLALMGTGLSADLAGHAEFLEGVAPAIEAHGQIQNLAVSDALAWWPVTIAKGARAWLVDNVTQGRIGPLAVALDIPAGALDQRPLPEESIAVTFPLEDVTARYMRGLTPLTGGRGTAQLSGDTFRLQMTQGNVGPLLVSSGDITIPTLHIPHAPGTFKVHAEGGVHDVLTLIDMEPLAYPKRFGINPATVSGQASLDLDFLIPMRRDLKVEDVRINVTAKASGVGVPIDAKRSLEAGIVSFTIDNQRLAAEGAGRVAGIPVAFRWNEEFAVAEGATTRVALQGRVDDTTRPQLGLSQPDWVKGTIPVTLELTGRRFRFQDGIVHADLTGTSVSLPQINVDKRPGTAATGSAKLHFAEGAVSVSEMAVTGPDLEVRGELAFNAAGNLVSVSLPEVKAGEHNDFSLVIDAPAGIQPIWRLGGNSIDGTELFAVPEENAAPAPQTRVNAPEEEGLFGKPITLEAKVERLVLRDGLSLRDADLTLNMGQNKRLIGFSLQADGPGPRGKMTGRYVEANGSRTVTIESDEAGDFMRAFTGFGSIRGGTAHFEAHFPAQPQANVDYDGNLVLTNIALVNQPFLARLFSLGSLDGPLRLLEGSGIAFSRLEAPFTAHDKVMMFREGRMSGPAIGFSFEGMIDRGNDTIDLNGSLVPVYGLNSMLGALPIVGNLLTSKEGEGIIAMTYRVRGDLDEPDVMVNPLSVFTPGIFRRIFEFGGPREPEERAPAPDGQAEAARAQ